jgi:hypothetical protein
MSAWSNFKIRLRLIGRSILQSEQHLGALPGAERTLDRLAETLPARLDRLANTLERTERHIGLMMAMTAREQLLEIVADARFDDPRRLERSGFKVHSQYDEDGIIAEIFRRIGTTNRECIEFGAGNGTENCTGFLLMQGWKGLWIDGGDDFLPTLNVAWKPEMARGQLVARHAFITVDNIDGIIREAGFSGEIDLLAVDLDGNDYHFLENISAVAPRVICAEYNANIPAHVDWKMERRDDYVWGGLDDRTGASLKALEVMLGKRGYVLVGCSLAGVNAFFVRQDLVGDKFADPFTAENHYHPWRFFYYLPGIVSNWREGPVQR